MKYTCSDCGEEIPSTPDYLIREHDEVCGFEARLKKAGLSIMSTEEACANDIHPMTHSNEDNDDVCSFCNKKVDLSKECCY